MTRPFLGLLFFSSILSAQDFTIQTIAGGGLPQNRAATSVGIGSVSGIAFDTTGNAYFSMIDFNIIMRMDVQGVLTVVAGNGLSGYSGDGGPALNATLNLPAGVAVDKNGNVYFADCKNNRVRKISNGIITTVAGDEQSARSWGLTATMVRPSMPN
jgi:DNA-binding beta-propeller fold protein YncE